MLKNMLIKMNIFIFLLLFSLTMQASEQLKKENILVRTQIVQFSDIDFWREARNGDIGYTSSTGKEHGQLINVDGKRWQEIRNKWISPLGISFIFAALLGLTFFYLWAGKIKLFKPKTGHKILRWTPFDRAIHWYTAILFLLLSLSGIILLYGKHILKPIFPESIWGNIILISKISHNYLGPLFIFGITCMLIKWFKNNLFNKVDKEWFKQGGGMLPNGKHPDADFCNAGEKVWFWLIATAGVIVCISGLILDFPIFDQARKTMQITNIIHSFTSLVLLSAALGHIYIGTIGTEGALEGMVTGHVDESWAEQHHKLWYDKIKDKKIKCIKRDNG